MKYLKVKPAFLIATIPALRSPFHTYIYDAPKPFHIQRNIIRGISSNPKEESG